MQSTMRQSQLNLIAQLESEPFRFEFFQAVRLLIAHQRRHSAQPDEVILEQSMRFRNSISLSFPPSEIESLMLEWERTREDGGQATAVTEGATARPIQNLQGEQPISARESRHFKKAGRFERAILTPAFMGLTGPSGVLPRHYTQQAADRALYGRDTSMRAFLDIFASRSISLFYQSWVKYRLHLQYEADRKNRFLPLVLSLGGLGFSSTRDRLADEGRGIADESLAYYAAALRGRPRSAQWFARIAEDYFKVPARTTEFVGHWLTFPPEEQTSLGRNHASLGKSAFCGDRIWDRQSRIRLTLGPMRKGRFMELLPGSAGYLNLARLFRLMQGLACECEVRLILDRRDISGARLQSGDTQVRLGWVGWLTAPESGSDAGDAAYLLSPEAGFD